MAIYGLGGMVTRALSRARTTIHRLGQHGSQRLLAHPTLSPDRAVMDLSGRPWGWANNASCAFKAPGSSRKLLQKRSANEQGANKAGGKVITVTSERPLSADLPAANSQATMTKSVRTEGPDGDAVECTLISVPDPKKKTVHDQCVHLKRLACTQNGQTACLTAQTGGDICHALCSCDHQPISNNQNDDVADPLCSCLCPAG